jgi:bacterioferritin-associated ferredoxin
MAPPRRDVPEELADDPGAREVCLCYHVSLVKLAAFARRTRPAEVSRMSECHGAGTGCGWCRPFLKEIVEQVRGGLGDELPTLSLAPQDYESGRNAYREWNRTHSLVDDDEPMIDELER